jgi:hypothetical protein
MAEKASKVPHPKTEVSVEEVNRILEVGRLLLSVLTTEELEELGALGELFFPKRSLAELSSASEIGNTGVT